MHREISDSFIVKINEYLKIILSQDREAKFTKKVIVNY